MPFCSITFKLQDEKHSNGSGIKEDYLEIKLNDRNHFDDKII